MFRLSQSGGGNCALCGSPGTNRSTCPLNKDIPPERANPAKHPLAGAAAKPKAVLKAPLPAVPVHVPHPPVHVPVPAHVPAPIAPAPAKAKPVLAKAKPKPKPKAKAKPVPVAPAPAKANAKPILVADPAPKPGAAALAPHLLPAVSRPRMAPHPGLFAQMVSSPGGSVTRFYQNTESQAFQAAQALEDAQIRSRQQEFRQGKRKCSNTHSIVTYDAIADLPKEDIYINSANHCEPIDVVYGNMISAEPKSYKDQAQHTFYSGAHLRLFQEYQSLAPEQQDAIGHFFRARLSDNLMAHITEILRQIYLMAYMCASDFKEGGFTGEFQMSQEAIGRFFGWLERFDDNEKEEILSLFIPRDGNLVTLKSLITTSPDRCIHGVAYDLLSIYIYTWIQLDDAVRPPLEPGIYMTDEKDTLIWLCRLSDGRVDIHTFTFYKNMYYNGRIGVYSGGHFAPYNPYATNPVMNKRLTRLSATVRKHHGELLAEALRDADAVAAMLETK